LVEIEPEKMLGIWVSVNADATHGVSDLRVVQETVLGRIDWAIGTHRISRRYPKCARAMKNVDGSRDGAKPFVTWTVFPDGVITTTFVMTEGDLELTSCQRIEGQLCVGYNGAGFGDKNKILGH
jgi:hypothetical protein